MGLKNESFFISNALPESQGMPLAMPPLIHHHKLDLKIQYIANSIG
jgi:hypothetical protein